MSTYSTTHHEHSGPPTGAAAPHRSKLANKLDPAVDSDLSKYEQHVGPGTGPTNVSLNNPGRVTTTTTTTTTGAHDHSAGPHSRSADSHYGGNLNSSITTGPARHTAGPHKSDLMNKLDPRVEEDLEGKLHRENRGY